MPGRPALLVLVAAAAVWVVVAAVAIDPQGEQARDLVTSLPGQPTVAFKQYAGYVTVSRTAGRALFYWFIEAAHNASSKPLALWLNGGPGCSSIGYGAMEEIGPFRMDKTRTSLALNTYSWNKAANLLFLESPAGVGFSYSNTSTDYSKSGDKRTAKDAYVFLKRWFQRFPHYKQRDLYIMGESYAGHYVPQLAKRIQDENARSRHPIRLRGFMVGNALIDDKADRLGRVDYWYTHALISRRTYTSIVRSCGMDGHTSLVGVECIEELRYARAYEQGRIDPYSIYAPVCVSDSASTTTNRSARFRDPVFRDVPYYGYDPCVDDYVESYFNRRDVQQAMHANQVTWSACSDVVHANWQDSVDTVLPIYKELIKAGLRIWVYSGDVDSVVPVTSSRYSVEKLDLNITTPWYPWYRNGQVGGYTEVYDGLTMATVRGAGHEVPLFQPGRALTLLRSFLDGKPLPSRS